MDPLFVLFLGMVIVFVGILYFKLHAFFTLTLAAMAVAAFSNQDLIKNYWLEEGHTAVAKVETVLIEKGISKEEAKELAWLEHGVSEEQAENLAKSPFGLRVAIAFGVTCGKIGIVICMASIIGTCLLNSGAALRIVRAILKAMGEKRAPAAMGTSGFFLGIPVFFDTVFYLMVPLAKALAASTKKNYGFYVLAIIAGGSIAHSQIPPTPGPLFVAEQLGIDIGTMMISGIIVGGMAAFSGMIYAKWINKRKPIPFRDLEEGGDSKMQKWDEINDSDLPNLWLSMAPIIFPLILLSGKTILTSAATATGADLPSWLSNLVGLLGDKNVALTIGACIGLFTLFQKKSNNDAVKDAMQSALASGGIVLMITCAGGAFGGMLQQSGIREVVAALGGGNGFWFLPMAFILTAMIRTVQGSATVAMITSVGILAPMASAGLDFHPIYLAMVIGFGSKPVPWMNDSGFWVISKMSGMTEGETLMNFSVMATIMAIVGLIVSMIGAQVIPFAG
ncbi:MAG: gluconate transporter [Opitutaceae bacterium]|nr:gluconate transporter [Opitutaceae bacterium]